MGVTGSGKSTVSTIQKLLSFRSMLIKKTQLVQLLSGADFKIGHGLESCTDKVEVTPAFDFEGYKIVLIDTPGFDDTNRSEKDILNEISKWLTNM
jgi:hypothetical protein